MLNIESKQEPGSFALFNLGFRPFFLAAGAFATISMFIWMGIYIFGWSIQPYGSAHTWHAHEMIFGYALAVIAGFLLTAVKNWTNVQTPTGLPLAIVFLLWLAGRVLPFFHTADMHLIALIDNLFILTVIISVSLPIIQKRQWQHSGILFILSLFLISNIIFYAGLLKFIENGTSIGLYSGLYLVIGLIFLMGRRVIPFFIEKGVDETVQLTNYKWLDISSPILFVGFWFANLFLTLPALSISLATILFILHAIRMAGWHTPGIWRKPLLWSIYLAYGFLTAGFALFALSHVFDISPFITLHTFAVGGIGLMTLGMMSRVALGHTGRDVFEPPKILALIFLLLIIASLVRIVLPMLFPAEYTLWIGVSQIFWITAFATFFLFYFPMLYKPRVDGRFG